MNGLERYWHIAAPSVRLGKKPLAVRVLDASLVVFRTSSGGVSALIDRCSHRGVPLSLGMLKDDCIRCPYHGWTFSKDGACTRVPSLPEQRGCGEQAGASARGIRSYPCVEHDGYVWVWLGEKAPKVAPPSIAGFADSHWAFGSIPFAASYEAVVENNVDVAHVSQLHHWWPPGLYRRLVGETPCTVEFVPREGGFEAYNVLPGASRSDLRNQGHVTFDLPYRVHLRAQLGVVPFELVIHAVPLDAKSSRMEWMFRRWLPVGPKRIEAKFEPFIIREDRELLEAAQRSYDRSGNSFEQSVPVDHVQLAARRMMRWSQAAVTEELPAPSLAARSFETRL